MRTLIAAVVLAVGVWAVQPAAPADTGAHRNLRIGFHIDPSAQLDSSRVAYVHTCSEDCGVED